MTDEIKPEDVKLPEPAWVWTKQPGNLQRILEGKPLLPEKGTGLFTADQVRAAVLAERERCAQVCDRMRAISAVSYETGEACAAAIRSGHSITETQRAEE